MVLIKAGLFRNYRRPEKLELWWCYLFKYSMDALPPIFHNIAMWLTVLLATQRYIFFANQSPSRHTREPKEQGKNNICSNGEKWTHRVEKKVETIEVPDEIVKNTEDREQTHCRFRYISISYPLYSRSICSVANVRIATVIITVSIKLIQD